MYLLDTNHCTRLLWGDLNIKRRINELDSAPVATSVISVGEMVYMAYRSDRLAPNLAEVEAFIADLPVYAIDSAIARVYGEVRSAVFARFGPKERAKQRHTTIPGLGFDDNDLWVTAIATHHGLVVATSDSDFSRIAEAVDLRHEHWLISRDDA
jgi:tRNA(fMet)-specific endonuclease VapC